MEAWQMLLRTAPHWRPSHLGQYYQKPFVDVFNKYSNIAWQQCPFLTTCTLTISCLASAAPQADSWCLGHVEPDDVVIADIAGQALDIFLHGPESAHKNGIVKTFTHTSIPIHTTKSNSKTLNSPNFKPSFSCPLLSNVLVGDSQEAWQMLLRTAPRRKPYYITDIKYM